MWLIMRKLFEVFDVLIQGNETLFLMELVRYLRYLLIHPFSLLLNIRKRKIRRNFTDQNDQDEEQLII